MLKCFYVTAEFSYFVPKQQKGHHSHQVYNCQMFIYEREPIISVKSLEKTSIRSFSRCAKDYSNVTFSQVGANLN
jgi:hypothetical protein